MQRTTPTILMAALIFSACHAELEGSGHVVERRYNIDNGDWNDSENPDTTIDRAPHIYCSDAFVCDVSAAERQSVTVEADDNITQYVRVKIENDIISVSLQEGVDINNATLRATIDVAQLHAVTARSYAKVVASGFSQRSIRLTAEDYADIELRDNNIDDAVIDVSNYAMIDLAGGLTDADIDATNYGSLRVGGVIDGEVVVDIDNYADTQLSLADSAQLRGSISNYGTLQYSGTPAVVDITTSNYGQVSH